jgi:hypothetical protein
MVGTARRRAFAHPTNWRRGGLRAFGANPPYEADFKFWPVEYVLPCASGWHARPWVWEDMAMRFSSLFVTSPAVAILSIELLCGLSGTAMSQTPTGSAGSLPSITVEAPRQVARPRHAVARSSVSRRTSPTTQTPSAAPGSVSAKLARLASATGSCVGGCATSFKYGNTPWHGCSVSGGTFSSTCRNTADYKTYAECTEAGLLIGWRAGDVSWYCTSLALK